MPNIASPSHKRTWGAQIEHGVARKSHLGNTNTSSEIAHRVVQGTLADHLDPQDLGWWLEPAVGVGNFYLALLDLAQAKGVDPWVMAQRIDAVDVDADAIAVLRQRLEERYGWTPAQVAMLPIQATSLVDFEPKHTYRGIVTNPPYLAPKNWGHDAEERADLQRQWRAAVPGVDARADLFIYFFHWCHRHLAPHGRSVFLCADGWLDAEYGQSLRDELTQGAFTLTSIQAWPWKALFRDDTCPIVTVVTRTPDGAGSTALILDDRDPLTGQAVFEGGETAVQQDTLTPADLTAWLAPGYANRRQRLVTDPVAFGALDRFLHRIAPHTVALGEVARFSTFGYSAQDLLRAGVLLQRGGGLGQKGGPERQATDADWDAAQPLFFQRQARVGKPVDYRQFRATAGFECRVIGGSGPLADKIARSARVNGVWVSQAIDRFPLVFVRDPQDPDPRPWVGVSKYLHLATDSPEQDRLLAAVLTSTPALLAIDRYFKEGTRKTLRVHENGYAKEVRKSDLEALQIPDFTRWPAALQRQVLELQGQRGQVSLARLDDAMANAAWQAMDALIAQAMGLTAQEHTAAKALVEALYWRRMRNTLRYGAARQRSEATLQQQ